jgi:hypothetical protein
MARDLYIQGPVLVKVRGTGALAAEEGGEETTHELGLTLGPVRVVPNLVHRDIRVDDFGPDIPAEIMSTLADAQIHMTLVHFDDDVLDKCIANSMGGQYRASGFSDTLVGGVFAGAGSLLGNGKQVGEPGNNFITLILTTTNASALNVVAPYRFPTAYICANPLDIPLGTERSLVTVRWRAIAYVPPFPATEATVPTSSTIPQEIKSRGSVLWYRTDPEPDDDDDDDDEE